MEALQRMMTRRLDEHSYKRIAKRLEFDECTSDTDIACMNSAHDVINGKTARTRRNPSHTSKSTSFPAVTCPVTTSPSSVYNIDPDSTVTATAVNYDHTHDDKLLRKVAQTVRRKLRGAKPILRDCKSCEASNCDKKSSQNGFKNSQKVAQNDSEKQIKLKPAKKSIYLVDLCAVGRKHRGEHRKLLSEEHEDD